MNVYMYVRASVAPQLRDRIEQLYYANYVLRSRDTTGPRAGTLLKCPRIQFEGNRASCVSWRTAAPTFPWFVSWSASPRRVCDYRSRENFITHRGQGGRGETSITVIGLSRFISWKVYLSLSHAARSRWDKNTRRRSVSCRRGESRRRVSSRKASRDSLELFWPCQKCSTVSPICNLITAQFWKIIN